MKRKLSVNFYLTPSFLSFKCAMHKDLIVVNTDDTATTWLSSGNTQQVCKHYIVYWKLI